jgi:hypothetical protein
MLGRKQGKIYNKFVSKLLVAPMSMGGKMNRLNHNHYVEKETEMDTKKLHSDLERRHSDHDENPMHQRRHHH